MNKQIKPGRPSLLLADREPGDSDEEAYEAALAKIESGPVPEFSGFRLHQREPRKYALICRMLGENLSTRMIARACAVSCHTIESIREREGASIEQEKSRLCDLARSVSRLCLERLAELIDDMSPRDLTIAAGVATEKWLLLADQPTSITVNRDEQMLHDNFNDLLSKLATANARIIDSTESAEGLQ